MKSIKIDLQEDLKKIEIHTFADLHLGDKHSNFKIITERIQAVADTENAYAILNGDIMNNATKTSVSDSYAEDLPPMEQIQRACRIFEPIKDKIIGITTGNHERRTYNKEGIDLMEVVARQMRLEDKFSPASCLIFIRFGQNNRQRKQVYTIFVNHGSGGGRKEGAKAARLAEMASIVDADIYIHSHTHLPMIMKQSFFRTNMMNSTVINVSKLFVNTSSTLGYGGYGEVFEFKPNSTDTPIIYLDGTKRDMTAML